MIAEGQAAATAMLGLFDSELQSADGPVARAVDHVLGAVVG